VIKLSGLQHEDSATLFSENAFALQSAEFSAYREDGCTRKICDLALAHSVPDHITSTFLCTCLSGDFCYSPLNAMTD